MAREDMRVSDEWRLQLLRELRSSNLFVALLSQHYIDSVWCMQEAGIAAFRRSLVVVPLSLDGTLPPGFLAAFQATQFDPNNVHLAALGAAIVKRDFEAGIDLMLREISSSSGFREGEANLRVILPFVPKMSEAQVSELLSISANTYRIIAANLCISDFLPPLVRKYGHLASPETLAKLKSACRL